MDLIPMLNNLLLCNHALTVYIYPTPLYIRKRKRRSRERGRKRSNLQGSTIR